MEMVIIVVFRYKKSRRIKKSGEIGVGSKPHRNDSVFV